MLVASILPLMEIFAAIAAVLVFGTGVIFAYRKWGQNDRQDEHEPYPGTAGDGYSSDGGSGGGGGGGGDGD